VGRSPSAPTGLFRVGSRLAQRVGRHWAWVGVAVATVVLIAVVGLVRYRSSHDERAARGAFGAGRYDQAEALVDRWIGSDPQSAAAHLLKARVALAQGRRNQFEKSLRRAQQLGADASEIALARAILSVKQRRHDVAIPVLSGAFDECRSPDPQLYEALARSFLETYDLNRAGPVLDRWVREVPDDPKPHLWRAEIDSRQPNKTEELLRDYREALRRDPTLAQAHAGLAEALRNAHRNDEAATEYDAYLALVPDDSAALLGAGRNALERGDEESAIRHYDRAIRIDGKNTGALRERAEIALRRGDAAAAITLLDRAFAIDPYDLSTRYSRSLALARLGRASEAKTEREAANRLRADQEELNKVQARLSRAPNDLELQCYVMRWMFEHGHGPEGVRWAERILGERPSHPEACRHLVEFYQRDGNPGLANYYRLQSRTESGTAP
jgi:tetratricopeptide (TPR) repeat protein